MKPHFQKILLALIVFISPHLLAQNSYSFKSGTKHSRFSIGSGINYSNKGYQYDLSGLTFGDMIDPRFGFVYQTQSVDDDWDSWYFNYTYIDIPLMAVYTFPGRKIRFNLEGGFVANILLDAYQTIGSTNHDIAGEFENFGISV